MRTNIVVSGLLLYSMVLRRVGESVTYYTLRCEVINVRYISLTSGPVVRTYTLALELRELSGRLSRRKQRHV